MCNLVPRAHVTLVLWNGKTKMRTFPQYKGNVGSWDEISLDFCMGPGFERVQEHCVVFSPYSVPLLISSIRNNKYICDLLFYLSSLHI